MSGLPPTPMRGIPPYRLCCGHSDTWHLDMKDGHEQCAGCDCRTATGTVDQTPEHDLTPSEVALARVLAAWDAWPGGAPHRTSAERSVCAVHDALKVDGWIDGSEVTDAARALLDRARKAGVV